MNFDPNTLAASPFVALVFAFFAVLAFATDKIVSGSLVSRIIDAFNKRENADTQTAQAVRENTASVERLAALLEGFLRGSSSGR